MKLIVTILSIFALSLASCSSTPGNAGSDSDAKSKSKAEANARPAQIPVEVKQSVLFDNGKTNEYTTSTWDGSYDSLQNQTRYSASGAVMEKVEYSSQQTANGTVQTKEVKDGEDNLKNRVTYQYNEQRQLIQEAILNKEGRPITIYKYGYDAQGNRTSRSVNSGSGVKLAETLYTYNNKSLVIKSETIDGAGKKISSTESQYDADNNLIKQQVKNANGEITTTINAVWENGHEVKNEQLGPDGKVQIRIAKEYGADGELLRKSIENFQGESRQVVAYEYTLKPEKK